MAIVVPRVFMSAGATACSCFEPEKYWREVVRRSVAGAQLPRAKSVEIASLRDRCIIRSDSFERMLRVPTLRGSTRVVIHD